MTPAHARAMYRRRIKTKRTFQRMRPISQGGPIPFEARTKVAGFSPIEIASGIDQGARKLIVLAEDVEAAIAAGWPGPLVKGDRVLVNGLPLVIQTVDDSTRRVDEVLIAYEITAAGS